MIEVKKKKLNKRSLPLVITSAILVLLIVGLVVTNTVISLLSGDNGDKNEPADYIPEIGESFYGNMALAYESFTEDSITGLVVGSHKGNYAMYRSEDENYFIICHEDENGDITPYYPSIVGKEGDFNYSSLYSIDDSGLGYKINYLFATLGTLGIDQRIELSDNEETRSKQLDRYGLTEDEVEIIEIFKSVKVEGEEEPKTEMIRIEIGDKLLAGTGYYYRVNGRDYVYTSSGTYLSYALGGFETFVEPNLVTESLPEDGVKAAYYTTDYKQWKNNITKYNSSLAVQPLVKQNSKVIGKVVAKTPVRDDSYYTDNKLNPEENDGYITGTERSQSFDLKALSVFPQYSPLISLMTSSRLGDYSGRNLLATIVSDTLEIDFKNASTVIYGYDILKIESVLTENEELDASYGYEYVKDVDGARMVKVTYDYYIGVEKQNKAPRHAVLNLSDLDADTLALVAESKIGEDVNISFTHEYDKETASTHGVSYVISEIAIILEKGEGNSYNFVDKVSETSTVTFRYYLTSGGKKISEEQSVTTEMSALKEGDYLKVKEALLGKSVGTNLEIVAFEDVIYTQIMKDFISYSFSSIDYFVESELVVSFEYVNASTRDPFYPGSLYVNTLPTTNKYSNYALNSTTCQQVVGLLQGTRLDSSSQQPEGLVGSETVAFGVTPENMDKYGLYANTIYFEIPRNIEGLPTDDPDELPDYTYFSTLGFTLYISDYDPEEKCRYVASDMYDIIVKVEDESFDYLDYSFTEYFARRDLIMIKYSDIESISLDFNLADFYGSYTLDTECQTVWVGGGNIYYTKPDNIVTKEYQHLSVETYVNGATSGNKLTDYLTASGKPSMDLGALYNRVASEELGQEVTLSSGYTSFGAASFQDVLAVMYNTFYLGILTPEEQAQGFETKKLMSMSVTVKATNNVPERTYTYDFYRIDDRRVMVSLYNDGYDNAVSDFYITTPAFKKIINNYSNLFNGVKIDADVMYE